VPRNPIETITQHIYPVRKELKVDLLLHMLRSQNMYSVLVFSRTKHGADKICRKLEQSGVNSVAIHSNRSQNQRQRAMDDFKAGKHQVMVATDIAARGIDIEGLSHVVNFDVPAFAEDYIHRIGRTGRAEATGDAITLVSSEEQPYLRKIEKFIGRKFTPEHCEDFDYGKAVAASSAGRHERGRFAPRTETAPRREAVRHGGRDPLGKKQAAHGGERKQRGAPGPSAGGFTPRTFGRRPKRRR
jgi:ATP-dependent RNA helicase RhlE